MLGLSSTKESLLNINNIKWLLINTGILEALFTN